MADNSKYGNIFKSTALFGFVQVFNILFKVGINKVVAVLLGTAGMGVISLFQQATALLSAACGLGINQSAVRDISEAREGGNEIKVSQTITLVRKIIRLTSLLGVVVTITLSPLISRWTFGNSNYTISYIFLSLVTGCMIQTMGYVAINTGMRQLKNVALSNLFGSMAGLIVAIPFYYFFREKGIVPSLIVSSFATMLMSAYYAHKVRYEKIELSLKESIKSSKSTIIMGISLMLMSMMLTLSSLILSSYISNNGGLSIVGLYQAGATIIVSYFAVIITAMSTEYYPRICGINHDNKALAEAVNRQSETGLIIALPLVVAFVFLIPYFIKFLYSEAFMQSAEYTDYAIIGSIAIICSNCMGMVLLAKQNAKIFLTSSLISIIIILAINILLYNSLGLMGLGIGYAVNGLFQFAMYEIIMKICYKISFSKAVFFNLSICILSCIGARFLRGVEILWLYWAGGLTFFFLSLLYILWYMQKKMDLNIIEKINNIIRKHSSVK